MRFRLSHCTGLAVAFLTVAPAAIAQEHNTEFTLFGAYRFGGTIDIMDSDASYAAQDSPSFGLIWNHRHETNTQWEVFFSRQKTEVELSEPALADSIVDVDLYTLQLGGTYLWEGDAIRPYLAATLGGTHIKSNAGNGDSDTFISGSIGVGLKMQPGARLGFRFEARAHGVLMRDSTTLFCQTCPSRLLIRKIFSSGSANVFMVESANMLEFDYFALIWPLYRASLRRVLV